MSKPWPRQGVHKIAEGTWLVPSKSVPGDFHTVTAEYNPKDRVYFTCSCRAGRERGKMNAPQHDPVCSHVRLANLAETDDGIPPRPTPPPNVSALVD